MRIAVATLSERGDRAVNEDAFNFLAANDVGCFILADGAGGHGCGDVASKAVVQEMLSAFSEQPVVSKQVLERGLDLARANLDRQRRSHAEGGQMDSTVVCLLLDAAQGSALWLQLGDSRIYLFRNQRAHLLTRDHSVLQSIIDAGLHRGSIRGAADRNRLYASVCAETQPADMLSTEPLAIEDGDIFLLCSDGFWDAVDEPLMEGCLRRSQNPRQWLDTLFGEGRPAGGNWDDNATALAVWLGCKDETTFFGTP